MEIVVMVILCVVSGSQIDATEDSSVWVVILNK
jgi:hypothetical protein